MRHQGWMLLIAGLIAVPQWTFSAEGWRGPAPVPQGFASHSVNAAADSRAPGDIPRGEGSPMHRYNETAFQVQPEGYRFRPWNGSGPSRTEQLHPYPRQYAASYWGGAPAAGGRIYPSPATATYSHQAPPSQVPVWRPAGQRFGHAPQAVASSPWAAPRYRFRPLPQPQQARIERPVRYRPLQVQIPDRYLFRPLNPVARTAAPLPSRRPATHYTPGAYPQAQYGYNPYLSGPVGSRYYPAYAMSYYAAKPWRGLSPTYRQPPRIPPQAVTPPAYAQGMNRMPRFRPEPRHGRRYAGRGDFRQRYARQRPAWHYPIPAPSPYWAQQRSPRYAFPGYGYADPMVQQSTFPPARLNRYGTDWYDGRGDGEGAWYRLAMEAVPAVSQSWGTEPATSGERK